MVYTIFDRLSLNAARLFYWHCFDGNPRLKHTYKKYLTLMATICCESYEYHKLGKRGDYRKYPNEYFAIIRIECPHLHTYKYLIHTDVTELFKTQTQQHSSTQLNMLLTQGAQQFKNHPKGGVNICKKKTQYFLFVCSFIQTSDLELKIYKVFDPHENKCVRFIWVRTMTLWIRC